MATFKAVVFNSKNHVKSDGTANVKIRIYHNRESLYIPTRFYINPEHMASSGEILSEFSGSDILNFEIQNVIQEYRKICIKLGSSRLAKMTCAELRDCLSQQAIEDSDYIDFVKFGKGVVQDTDKEKTKEWYQTAIDILIWHFGKSSIDVRDITSTQLTLLIQKLQKKGPKKRPLKAGAISNYLRGIRALLNKCKLAYNNEDLDLIRIQGDPFKKVKIPEYKRTRKNISIEEIKKIRDRHLTSDRENIGRDIFMMQFYLMGININDLFNLAPPVAGRLNYYRSKTDTDDNINAFQLSVKIEPELKELILKYSSDGFLSDIRKRYLKTAYLRTACNKGLKKICQDLNYPIITTNWARHSWASLARNKAEISKADIDFCLGHVNKDYKMADIYIDIDYSIYDKANRKVLDLLLPPKPDKKMLQNISSFIAN